MLKLIYSEILKLKHSVMFLISLVGSCFSPFLCFIAFVTNRARGGGNIYMEKMFEQTHMLITLFIGILLYGVVIAYIFNREYLEKTLKTILTIPVSRFKVIISKLILLFIWILLLSVFNWIVTVIFGFIGNFKEITAGLVFKSLKQYLITGIGLSFLSTPVIFVALLFKNYVPTIIFTVCITMVNILITQSDYIVLYPWSALYAISTGNFLPQYSPFFSYLSIFITFMIGLIASVYYFLKADIN